MVVATLSYLRELHAEGEILGKVSISYPSFFTLNCFSFWLIIESSGFYFNKEVSFLISFLNSSNKYKGNPICLTADLSAETLQARREWQDIFKALKEKNLQPRFSFS